MYYTTGFSRHEIEDLCALIAEIQQSAPVADRHEWPPILGLGNSVVITLTYLRRNRVQWELVGCQVGRGAQPGAAGAWSARAPGAGRGQLVQHRGDLQPAGPADP